LTVVDYETGAVLAIERMNLIDYRVQRQRLAEVCAQWQPESILAEQNSMGDPLIEDLQADGLPVQGFVTTQQSKARIIEALALAFQRREVSLPDDPLLLSELKTFTIARLPGGSFRYSAPPGRHDDYVMSLALAHEARACASFFVEAW